MLLAFPAQVRCADTTEDSFKKIDLLIDEGAYPQARAALDELLAALKPEDPSLVRGHERTGAAWLREGKIPEARASFTAALRVIQRLKLNDDSVAKVYAGMGLCLRRENNDAYALRFFKKALAFRLDEGTKMFVEDQIREIEGTPPVLVR